MSTWAERAKAAVSQKGQNGTAILEKYNSSKVVTEDPDRWCWPNSSAMNGVEIDTFVARLHKFTDKGWGRNDGEALAAKLVLQDCDQDDRRVCRECKHFAGHGAGSWRCCNWQAAGIAIRSRDAHKDVKTLLERLAELLERNLATLKRGQTLADLQERARAKTDLQAAQEMQKAKADLFALFNKPKTQQQAA